MNPFKTTSPSRISFLILACLTLLLSGCTMGLKPLADSVDLEVERSLDRGFDGIIVYVNQGGKSSFHSAGFHNREEQIPADPHALFKIASISKLYMAAATAKLVAAGTLSLESTLDELIPEVADSIEYADEITLKLMLQHRSGIPDFVYHPDFPDRDPYESYLATASLMYDQGADFAPDRKYSYSNTNYLLLGEILDRTLGYSHNEYIKEEILLPLGLVNTYLVYNDADPDEVMSGYILGYEPDLKGLVATRPGGTMVATAEDVGTFLRALIDGSLLSEKEQEIYTSVYEYDHTGWLPGYTSIAAYHSEIDAVVIQFVSTSGKEIFWLELRKVYKRIVRILENQPLQ